jgi:hypothetical protein
MSVLWTHAQNNGFEFRTLFEADGTEEPGTMVHHCYDPTIAGIIVSRNSDDDTLILWSRPPPFPPGGW